jgi:hypothetical protein
MQTFLPYADFEACAKVLDRQRLGKQRAEAYQILRVLAGQSNGWRYHPAVRMWRGYENALRAYLAAMIDEWVRRGYVNNLERPQVDSCVMPPWLGRNMLHSSHRSNLLRKDPQWYGQFGWTEQADLPYHWPV